MSSRQNSFKGADGAPEAVGNIGADLIIQTKRSAWFKYIIIGGFIWRTKTRAHLRRAKRDTYRQRFLNKLSRLDVKQKISHIGSYFKDRSYIPLLTSPTTPPAAASNHVINIPLQEQTLNEVARIVRDKDLNALRERGGVDGVVTLLRSHSEDQAVDGGQVPQLAWKTTEPGYFHYLLKACNKLTIFFLVGSAGLQFSIEFKKHGIKKGWHDGFATLFTVFLLVIIPSIGNYRNARKTVKQLIERSRLLVNVERSGESSAVAISHVSVGDIVHLKEGDHAPADGLFINHDAELEVDEVLNPIIDYECNPFLLSGSKVVKGCGQMVVTSVGVNTAYAEILSLVTEDDNPDRTTLLQALMKKPYNCAEYLACGISFLIAIVVLIRLLLFKKHDNYNDRPDLKGEVSMHSVMNLFERFYSRTQGKVYNLVTVLATAVIGIQHGMPFVISLALSQWKHKVVQNRVDPRNLSACVTMGLITVICIETTSEKMCNQMEVRDFWIREKDLTIGVESDETEQYALKELCQEISATPENDAFTTFIKNRWGTTDMEVLDQIFETVEERKSILGGKCSGILVRRTKSGTQDMQLHVSGDASTILDMCSHYNDKAWKFSLMESQKIIMDMEENGLKPIAYAYKKTYDQEFPEDGFKLLALVGVRCQYQEDLKMAVKAFRNAGIRIKLVSEDELSKVSQRASDLGIISNPGDEALEGVDFRRLSSMERMKKVDLISVMGSSLPKDKLLLVERLKRNGHIVAFYGGLTINDTPTLKEADVGITEDKWSTEVARDNADVVAKVGCVWIPILMSGKCAYHNIQNFCQIHLTYCISGLLVALVATMHSGESPLTMIHLIWVNFIMCLLGGLMMVMELKGQELLTQKPALRTQSLITKVIRRSIAIQVLYQATVLLVLHFMGNAVPSMNKGVRDTMIFNFYTLCQILNLLRTMDLVNKEVLKVVLHSYWFLMALGVAVVMQVVIVELGKDLASGARLDVMQWAICFLLAALSWVFDWAINSLSASIRIECSALMVSSPRVTLSHSTCRFFFLASLFFIFTVSHPFQTNNV